MAIDITFDFRTDADGKDPDSASPTLRFGSASLTDLRAWYLKGDVLKYRLSRDGGFVTGMIT